MKVLFVCTGNTCRSPMAAAILEKRAKAKGFKAEGTSAGIYAPYGANIHPNAREALNRLYNTEVFHFSMPVNKTLIDSADLVVAMTSAHLQQLEKLFGKNDKFISMPEDIPDPFGMDLQEYEKTALEIEKGIDRLLETGVIHD